MSGRRAAPAGHGAAGAGRSADVGHGAAEVGHDAADTERSADVGRQASDAERSAGAERSAAVIVASTSAAAGSSTDTTGPAIREWLMERGFACGAPAVVADGGPVGEALRAAIAAGSAVVITTGGTGISPSDATPEQTDPLLDVRLPGLIEEVRRRGAAHTPMAVLTRGVAGFAGDCFVMNLPGSPAGVRDGLAVLDPVLAHLLDQRAGGARH